MILNLTVHVGGTEPVIDSDNPERDNRGTILGVMALALSFVALCVAVFT